MAFQLWDIMAFLVLVSGQGRSTNEKTWKDDLVRCAAVYLNEKKDNGMETFKEYIEKIN